MTIIMKRSLPATTRIITRITILQILLIIMMKNTMIQVFTLKKMQSLDPKTNTNILQNSTTSILNKSIKLPILIKSKLITQKKNTLSIVIELKAANFPNIQPILILKKDIATENTEVANHRGTQAARITEQFSYSCSNLYV